MSEKIQSPSAGKSILLAEDQIDHQELMRDMLELMQHNIDVANDGVEAVEKWKKNKYDLILMDIQMPNMDGLQATSEIRKLEDGVSHIPILAVTAYALTEDRKKCLQAGMDDCLIKPLTIDELEKKLSKFFREKNS